jgi:hypothetical protein
MGLSIWILNQFYTVWTVYVHCTIIVKNYFALQHGEKPNQQVRFRRLPFRKFGITNFRSWASGNLSGGRTMISTNCVVNQYPVLGTKE